MEKRDNHFDYQAERVPNSIFDLNQSAYQLIRPRLEELAGHEWKNAIVNHTGERVIIALHLTQPQAMMVQEAIRRAKIISKIRSN